MAILLQEALERLAAIEVEALADLTPPITADAKAYAIHQQEAFPYFTNRVGPSTIESNSEDFDGYEVEIVARLIIGHVTDGYRGQPESVLNTCIPAVIEAINARELLQSNLYPDALDGLVSARCTGASGLRVYENAGIQAKQVGSEFTVVLQYADDLTQLYT